MTNTKSEIAVTFNPQEWVDGPYHLDDGADKQLTPAAENRGASNVRNTPGRTELTRRELCSRTNPTRRISYNRTLLLRSGSEIGMGHTTFGQNRLPTSNGQLTEQIKYLENSRSEPWPLKSHAGRVDTF